MKRPAVIGGFLFGALFGRLFLFLMDFNFMKRSGLSAGGRRLGWDDTVCALPLGSAKAFGGTIHWMVPPLCLLTLLGGTLRVPVSTGASRTRPSPFVTS